MVKIFSDWIKTIWNSLGKILSRKSKTSIVLFYSYETINLKLYFEIIESQEFKRLIVSGEADENTCAKQWDKIIQRNYQENGGYDYINYIDLMTQYGFLLAEYNIVKACLLKLISLNLEAGIVFLGSDQPFVKDEDILAELADYGYKIDTSTSQRYAEGLNTCLIRVENLKGRMNLVSIELEEMMESEGDRKPSFDSIMAFLYSQFPHVPEDITLSRYNELMRILKEKHSTKKVVTTDD